MDISTLVAPIALKKAFKRKHVDTLPTETIKILEKHNPTGLVVLQQTRDWALHKHGAQKYGNFPYIVHLDDAVRVGLCVWPNMPTEYLLALQLHDVIEDTTTNRGHVTRRTCADTGAIVKGVTNNAKLSREEQTAQLNLKLQALDAREFIALGILFVKICDRFGNVSRLRETKGLIGLKERYVKEYPEFKAAVSGKRYRTSGMQKNPNPTELIINTLLEHLDIVHAQLLPETTASTHGEIHAREIANLATSTSTKERTN